jgi:hypothetical protein
MRILWVIACLVWTTYGQGKVLILTPPTKGFLEAIEAMNVNLTDMDLKRFDIDENTNSQSLHQLIARFNPNLIVLMDNKSIRAYKQYLTDFPNRKSIPVVALMALQIESALSGLPQVIGISYEIPAVTTVNRLRGVLQSPIRKVGVLYRSGMTPFFKDHQKWCKVENIELIGYEIGDDSNPGYEMKKGLHHLVHEEGIQALWVLNDNLLLTPKLIKDIWLPFMKNNPMPGIVGVEPLVQSKLHFGTFAALPDPAGLGAQAANLIYEIQEDEWLIAKKRIEKPLSVIQILNLSMARKVGKLKPNATKLVDKVVE